MNEKTILKIFVGICFVALIGIGSLFVNAVTQESSESVTYVTTTDTGITEEKAVSIASSLNLGTFQEVELEDEDGTLVYAVEYVDGKTEYEVLIDATTGEVLEIDSEEIITADDITVSISEEEAKTIARGAVDGTVTEVEIEEEDGSYVYAVEMLVNGEEVDVLIDVNTGIVVEIETEDDDDDDDEEEVSEEELEGLNSDITESEAKAIALAALGGGEVTDIEVEKDHGKYVYEVEVQYKGDEVDVVIDMENGDVLDIEED
jgi:uncharacterized membrane protein YkoI